MVLSTSQCPTVSHWYHFTGCSGWVIRSVLQREEHKNTLKNINNALLIKALKVEWTRGSELLRCRIIVREERLADAGREVSDRLGKCPVMLVWVPGEKRSSWERCLATEST